MIDSTTIKVLSGDPDIVVWLYGNPTHSAGKFVAIRTDGVNIEKPVHRPNFAAFKMGYETNPRAAYFVIQGHPPSWTENDFAEFVRIIDFLIEKKTRFVSPSDLPGALKSYPR